MLNANEIAKPEKKVYSIRILERKCQKEKKLRMLKHVKLD